MYTSQREESNPPPSYSACVIPPSIDRFGFPVTTKAELTCALKIGDR